MGDEPLRVLITGGTGSLGQALIHYLLQGQHLEQITRLVSFARSESRQKILEDVYTLAYPQFRTFIGDVRDHDRLVYAMRDIDLVIHAAALKRVDAACDQPFETILTNVIGTKNVIEAAMKNHVKRVVLVSSDKAVEAANVYGASKACAEHGAVQMNAFAHADGTAISVVRYGNVFSSTGSLLHILKQQAVDDAPFTLTDTRMTRFGLTLEEACVFVWRCVHLMRGGEIFVPDIPSFKVQDLMTAVDPDRNVQIVGLRPGGEKLGEVLISRHESAYTVHYKRERIYIVNPSVAQWGYTPWVPDTVLDITRCTSGFSYASETNTRWLNVEQLRQKLGLVS